MGGRSEVAGITLSGHRLGGGHGQIPCASEALSFADESECIGECIQCTGCLYSLRVGQERVNRLGHFWSLLHMYTA